MEDETMSTSLLIFCVAIKLLARVAVAIGEGGKVIVRVVSVADCDTVW